MIELIEVNRDQIAALCRENDITALWIFGSAAKGTWDRETSDIDFLVDLGEYDERVARRFMRLAAGLEMILGHDFDLLTVRQLKRPEFRTEVLATREVVFERERVALAG